MTKYFSPIAKTLVCALTITSLFSSCSKDNGNPGPPLVLPAGLALIHAAPGVAELDFYVVNQKANKVDFSYNTALIYGGVAPGTYELSVTKKGLAEKLGKLEKAEFKTNKAYSAFVTDVTANTIVFVEDDLTPPTADKAKIRLVNLGADAGILDLAITGKAEAVVSKIEYKKASAFVETAAGDEINFEIKENGKTDVLATLPKVKIEKGKIYTIWARGLKAATKEDAKALKLSVMNNTSGVQK